MTIHALLVDDGPRARAIIEKIVVAKDWGKYDKELKVARYNDDLAKRLGVDKPSDPR